MDGNEFKAHKLILSARSSVFERMFTSGQFVESKNNRVQIDDISKEVMEPLLQYIYGGDVTQVKQFEVDPLLELFEAAHKVMKYIDGQLLTCIQSP